MARKPKADRERIEFFKFASHELKAPLVAVQSSLRLIDEMYRDKLDPRVADLVGRALSRADQLMLMIRDMLDISIDESSQRTTYTCVDVVGIVRDVLALQEVTARQNQIALLAEVPFDKCFALCNRVSMEKVLDNLLSNALRYTPAGGSVRVKLSMDTATVDVDVIDTGIGIAPEDNERIFEEFYRGANARRHNTIGTGLGLALVKKVMAEHGGTVSAKGAPGIGSTFTIRIPIGDCHAVGQSDALRRG